jgi:hypothetical protein
MRLLGERIQDSTPAARAAREETLPMCADCSQFAIYLDSAIIDSHV